MFLVKFLCNLSVEGKIFEAFVVEVFHLFDPFFKCQDISKSHSEYWNSQLVTDFGFKLVV